MAGGLIYLAYHYKYHRRKVVMEFFGFNSSENFKEIKVDVLRSY